MQVFREVECDLHAVVFQLHTDDVQGAANDVIDVQPFARSPETCRAKRCGGVRWCAHTPSQGKAGEAQQVGGIPFVALAASQRFPDDVGFDGR